MLRRGKEKEMGLKEDLNFAVEMNTSRRCKVLHNAHYCFLIYQHKVIRWE